MAGDISFHLLRGLKVALIEQPPYCFGILEVPPDNFKLYYGRDEARFIDLQEASKSNDHGALETLAQACEPAPFGRGEETVLDGTYRKAGKLDVKDFMTGLDLEKTGLLDTVRLGLPSGRDEGRTVHAELYKLNVYGEGAFFKPHKDTPRGQDMFGSLVVIFPTPHEGGTLVFRHENIEHPFDAADMLSRRPDYVAYAAFFSDVEHEVAPVTSGHRVTLTYNLYYGAAEHPAVPAGGHLALRPFHASTPSIQILLGSLLEAPTFLPQGGTLGFRAASRLPVSEGVDVGHARPARGPARPPQGERRRAAGGPCTELGLAPDLRLVRDGLDGEIMLGGMVELGPLPVEDPARELVGAWGGVLLHSLSFTGDAQGPWCGRRPRVRSQA
ncbi:hypothetical protein LXA43DRAFT_1163312 [Ganoderma leucocontextum]|nr:hypothetical protein LXA43DRAFT_1163312 [Ganoderma leucocontextum]